jgi:hypothetical protein
VTFWMVAVRVIDIYGSLGPGLLGPFDLGNGLNLTVEEVVQVVHITYLVTR